MKTKQQAIIQLVLLIAILIGLNVVGAYVYKRLDLTKEKRYSLTSATKNLLREIDDIVYVQVFLEGEFPAGMKRLRNSTQEMLNEFRAYAGNNIEYEFIDPLEDVEGKERQRIIDVLTQKGIIPRRLIESQEGYSEKVFFPAALVAYKGRELPVTLLLEQLNQGPQEVINNSIALLEYNLANAIQKLGRPYKPSIAFLEGHGELDELFVEDIAASLSQYYTLERYNINNNYHIPIRFNALVIAQPTKKFEEVHKFKIDQYIMNGGKVLWLIENLAANLDSLKRNGGSFIALDRGLNLEDQLFKYGVRVDFNLLQDLQCTEIPLTVGTDKFGNATQLQNFPWMYSPILTENNNEHPATKNIGAVLGQFTATIDTLKQKNTGVKKTVLLKSSPYSRRLTSPIRIQANDVQIKPKQEDFENGGFPVAVALEGTFTSPFENRLTSSTLAMIDTIKDMSVKYKSDPTRMIVMSDADFIRNEVDRQNNRVKPLGYYPYTRQSFANKDFIFNCIEWLTDEKGIIAARSKDVKLRLLDKQKVESEKTIWQVYNIVIPILIVLVFGFIYTFVRRTKWAVGSEQ